MKPALDKPLVCPSIIGRQAPLEALDGLLRLAGEAKAQVLLLNGEAGIGKSRLIAEAINWSQRAGWLLFQGNCFESDLSLPFAPFIDLLRSYLETQNSTKLAESMGPAA